MGERAISESAPRNELGAEGGFLTDTAGVAPRFGGNSGRFGGWGFGTGRREWGWDCRVRVLLVRLSRFVARGPRLPLGVIDSEANAPSAVHTKIMNPFRGSLVTIKSIRARTPYAR